MVGKRLNLATHSVDETRELGKKIGSLIDHPVTIALIGDLGCGKTAFVQGLAQGLEVPADYYITSPTFTLINEYPGRLPLFHVDLYRLEGINDFEDIGLDELLHDQAVIVVEWADKLPDAVFDAYLSMTFEIIADNSRKISIKASGQNEMVLIKTLETKMNAKTLITPPNL
jgi:tRNA threonylcarbamoyladenosine biosynthesis protein TsaE